MKLLLDANLAVLLAVGLADRSFIKRHKRLGRYVARDFDALAAYARTFNVLLFLPNTLTEVSNLAVQGVREPLRTGIVTTLKELIVGIDETYVPSRRASGRPEFERLGLTDAALLDQCRDGALLLTDDDALFHAACRSGVVAESFSRFRSER